MDAQTADFAYLMQTPSRNGAASMATAPFQQQRTGTGKPACSRVASSARLRGIGGLVPEPRVIISSCAASH